MRYYYYELDCYQGINETKFIIAVAFCRIKDALSSVLIHLRSLVFVPESRQIYQVTKFSESSATLRVWYIRGLGIII